MSFEYNGVVYRDLEPQVRYDAEQVQLLKQADVTINEKIDSLPLGGEKVSLTFPAGDSSGTITAEQLTLLQASESNYIEMVNDKELYYLNDNGHVDGYLTYSHVGVDNGKATIKTLTITVSAKSFVIVKTVVPTSEGKKYYLHNISCSGPSGTTAYDVQIKAISSSITPYTYDTYNSLNVYKQAICTQFGFTDSSFNYHYYPTGNLKSAGGITYYEGTTLKNFSMYSISNRFADTVIEL